MRLDQLIFFCRIVEKGSFSQASRELNLTQPALTTAIKSLELELGQPLFLRESTGIKITEFGSVVYKDSREILIFLK